jgi:hypothetical protein
MLLSRHRGEAGFDTGCYFCASANWFRCASVLAILFMPVLKIFDIASMRLSVLACPAADSACLADVSF